MSVERDLHAWLRRHGAEDVAHPGGTLYAHLTRVHGRLAGHGLDPATCLAGLAHAAYGTDGFATVLLPHADRAPLRGLIGAAAEEQVYRYGACDRARTWRDLPATGTVTDRFTGAAYRLDADALRSFVDLSIVNELDVVERDPAVARRYGDYFRTLFATWAPLASPGVVADARRVLGG